MFKFKKLKLALKKSFNNEKFVNKILFSLFMLNILDLLTTIIALMQGQKESNPIILYFIEKGWFLELIIFKLFFVLGFVFLIKSIRGNSFIENKPIKNLLSLWFLTLFLNCFYFFIVSSNIFQIFLWL